MKSKEELLNKLLKELRESELDLKDQLEVLANIFINIGVNIMKAEGSVSDEYISPAEAMTLVLNNIRERGNTLGNSIAMQGIVILEWLSRS